jgi:hypothetical protein
MPTHISIRPALILEKYIVCYIEYFARQTPGLQARDASSYRLPIRALAGPDQPPEADQRFPQHKDIKDLANHI